MDEKRQLFRHLVATVAFRGRVAVEDAPPDFPDFRASDDSRSAREILAHIGDLFTGSVSLLRGDYVELDSVPLPWPDEVARFYDSIEKLDDLLASDEPLAFPVEKFVQGPVGDALTHVGQIVLLRRLSGVPVKSAMYFSTEINPGEY